MALKETTLFGEVDKVKMAIDRLQAFEPKEGYYLAFSGGKDSMCIYHLAIEAGVKFDAHYNITGLDPPELVYFIREYYPDVKRDMYNRSMFRLIQEKGLPTRLKRWCCVELKERGGEDRVCVTGVRWAESNNRRNDRKPFEVKGNSKKENMLFNDNADERRMFENCMQKGKRVVNPIIDWEDEDVWEFIKSRNLPYCKLYDEGYSRLGCIGCPMVYDRKRDFKRYPKFEENYKRAIARFLPIYLERREKKGIAPFRDTVDGFWEWWLQIEEEESQMPLLDYLEEQEE